MKKIYIKPFCKVVKIDFQQIIATSFTGTAPDSNDTEFGAPAQRRGEWGDLWEDKWE